MVPDFFDTPPGAVLVRDEAGISLIAVERVHEHKVTVERYRLGETIPVADLLRLLDSVGHLPPAAAPGHVALAQPPAAPRQPALPAPPSGEVACPECRRMFKGPKSLGIHRSKAHGVAGTAGHSPKGKAGITALDLQIDALRKSIVERRDAGVDDAQLAADRTRLVSLVERASRRKRQQHA
jgi:hypothetical protein